MNKAKTNILVIGDTNEAATLFSERKTTEICFSRCAGDNDMATLLRQPGRRYDWILVNAVSFDGDQKELIRSLRTTGFFISHGFRQGGQPCGVEWLADGSLQMHCCMRPSAARTCGRSQNETVEKGSVVFEYQAPTRRAK